MTTEEILSKVLGIPAESINDETGPSNTPSWDSFNALLLITEFEKTFKVEFSLDEVSEIKKVADIKKILEKYKVI